MPIIGSIAYFRSGGKQDISAAERTLNEKIKELETLAHRAGDGLATSVRAGYQRSVRALDELRALMAALSEVAVEEVKEDFKTAFETLDRLAERAAREIKEVKAGMDANVIEAEETLRREVEEARARLAVIEAKQHLLLARLAVRRNDLEVADAQVTAALSHLSTARSQTAKQAESFEATQKQAQRLLAEIRAKADTIKATFELLIERNNRLLAELSDGAREPQVAVRGTGR